MSVHNPDLISFSECAGTYALINIINGRTYYGSCARFKIRAYDHNKALERGRHCNQFLQNDFNKCGTDAFVFKVLEVLPREPKNLRLEAEQKLLDLYWDNCDLCYNIAKDATNPMSGKIVTEETKAKMSLAQRNRKDRSITMKGKHHNPETKAKMSLAHKGRHKVLKPYVPGTISTYYWRDYERRHGIP